jgi:hypothetical protein
MPMRESPNNLLGRCVTELWHYFLDVPGADYSTCVFRTDDDEYWQFDWDVCLVPIDPAEFRLQIVAPDSASGAPRGDEPTVPPQRYFNQKIVRILIAMVELRGGHGAKADLSGFRKRFLFDQRPGLQRYGHRV